MKRLRTLTAGKLVQDLAERQIGQASTAELIERHEVSPSTISFWSRKFGFPPLKRGRKTATVPTPDQIQILAAIRSETLGHVGARYGVSKQRIWAISKRWKNFQLPETPKAQDAVIKHLESTKAEVAKREVRPFVISFRLSESEMISLRRLQSICLSSNQAARAILTKTLAFLTDQKIEN